MYSELCKSISKIAVGLEIVKDGEKFCPVITQNSKIIEFFNPDKRQSIVYNDDESKIITAYEVTLDQIVAINFSDVKAIHWWGIPFELTPPTYLLPELSGYVTDDQLFEAQRWFLERVKKDRDRGCFTDKNVPKELLSSLGNVFTYFLSLVDNSESRHPIINFFKDWPVYKDFNMNRNLKDIMTLFNVYESMYIIPAVQACLGRELTIENDLEMFLDKSIFTDLKDKWIEYLLKLREETLTEKQKEIIDLSEKYRVSISNIVEIGLNRVYTLQQEPTLHSRFISNFVISDSAWDAFLKTDGLDESDNKAYAYSTSLKIIGITQDQIDILFNALNNGNQATIEAFEEMKAHIDDQLFEYNQLKTQYGLLIENLKNLDIYDDLNGLDDYRLYLRYWPECFDYNPGFHDNIRPFTDMELYVIKFFIREKLEFAFDSVYRAEFDYYNSIIDILDVYKDKVIEKRLDYITKISQLRKTEIEKEMGDVELSEEEKTQFSEILSEMTNIVKYREELKQEKNLINILAYWPVALYPIPEDILQL